MSTSKIMENGTPKQTRPTFMPGIYIEISSIIVAFSTQIVQLPIIKRNNTIIIWILIQSYPIRTFCCKIELKCQNYCNGYSKEFIFFKKKTPVRLLVLFRWIDYNRKSFIYMQPIDDRIEFQGNDYNRKNPQVKEFHFYLTPNSNFFQF